jgi:hypothetical protein
MWRFADFKEVLLTVIKREYVFAMVWLLGAWWIGFATNQLVQPPVVAQMPGNVWENRLVVSHSDRRSLVLDTATIYHLYSNWQRISWVHTTRWGSNALLFTKPWTTVFHRVAVQPRRAVAIQDTLHLQHNRITPTRVVSITWIPKSLLSVYSLLIPFDGEVRSDKRSYIKKWPFLLYVVL